jgi:hypothetical protein
MVQIEHLLPGYKLRGVGTLSSPHLYSDLHEGIPTATLFLCLFYVRISVVHGNMGRYKSWHFKDRIFGDARCSTSSAQVFHPCLLGSHILVGRRASLCKAPSTLGRACEWRSFAFFGEQYLSHGAPGIGHGECDSGVILANSGWTSLLPGYESPQRS